MSRSAAVLRQEGVMARSLAMSIRLVRASVLLACALAACRESPVDEEFTLAPGESVVVSDSGPKLTFEEVVEDSRCPMDAICVWAGQVVIDVSIGNGSPARHSMRPDESVLWGRFEVRLVRVLPYPKSDAPIEPSDYRATFRVQAE
jgi:hypothetical protein